MEKAKKWEEYTPQEKTDLLKHWFYYYGGTLVTFQEIEDFETLALTRQDDIFNYIMSSLITQKTIQSNLLVFCMRENKVEELFEHTIKFNDLPKDVQEKLSRLKQDITDEIVGTYLNPEPSKPMDIAIVVKSNNGKK